MSNHSKDKPNQPKPGNPQPKLSTEEAAAAKPKTTGSKQRFRKQDGNLTGHALKVSRNALNYIKLGWSVLLLWGTRDGKCLCAKKTNCESPGKHPIADLFPHGVKDATNSVDEIRDGQVLFVL